jgi:hypothetical protein
LEQHPLAKSDLIDDAVLGRVTRDAWRKHWLFNVLLPNGRMVPGVIIPEHDDAPPSERALARIGERVGWVRDNEPAVRDHITKKMYNLWLRGWHDDQIDPVSREQFRERIWLASLTCLEDRRLSLHYNDAHLFGGRPIVQSINSRGKFDGAPDLGH